MKTAPQVRPETKPHDASREGFRRAFGKSPAWLLRAPGRVNLKGVHIEHQGGAENSIAIPREVHFAVSPRDDDRVVACNEDAANHPERSFSISEFFPRTFWGRWDDFLRANARAFGGWTDYVKAGVCGLQNRFPDTALRGFDLYVRSDLPTAAGLSSSSALTVGAMLSGMFANGIELSGEEQVDASATAEWLLGARGGAGDQAVILHARQGHVNHQSFFPYSITHVPFPDEYRVVVADSHRRAPKAEGARERFNCNVATYGIGTLLVRELFPDLSPRIDRLSDLRADHLGIPEGQLYAILKALPAGITRMELIRDYPAPAASLTELFRSHEEPPEGYRVRDVMLFGIAECHRSRLFGDALRRRDEALLGTLMARSHDGDRVLRNSSPWTRTVTGDDLAALERARAPVHLQPGGYGCSCGELDLLVDLALEEDGVIGANLTGAGLGGCVVALAHPDAVPGLLDRWETRYYTPRLLSPGAEIVRPVGGAGVLEE